VDQISPILKRVESLYNRKKEPACREQLFDELPKYIEALMSNANALKLSARAKEEISTCAYTGQKKNLRRPKKAAGVVAESRSFT
jgi:hypothetical protein